MDTGTTLILLYMGFTALWLRWNVIVLFLVAGVLAEMTGDPALWPMWYVLASFVAIPWLGGAALVGFLIGFNSGD